MKAPRVFLTADIGAEALRRLVDSGFDVDVHPAIGPPTYEQLTAKDAAGVDGLVTTIRDRVDNALLALDSAARLKIVAQVAVGYDNIDVGAATRHQIPVANTPDVLSDASAEFAFFIMGDVARKLYPSEELVRRGRWGVWHPHHPWLGDNVAGKTVAVIGTGRIGKAFVHKARSGGGRRRPGQGPLRRRHRRRGSRCLREGAPAHGLTPGDERLILKLRLFNHLGSGTYETGLSADPNVGMAGRAVQSVIDRLSGADPRGMAFVVNRHDLGSLENG